MAKLNHTEMIYPTQQVEVQIRTKIGRIVKIYSSDMIAQAIDMLAQSPSDYKLVHVITTVEEINFKLPLRSVA